MSLLRAEQAKATITPVTVHTPIAQSLLLMDELLQERMGKMSDI